MVLDDRAGDQALQSGGLSGFDRGDDKDPDVVAGTPDLQQPEDANRAGEEQESGKRLPKTGLVETVGPTGLPAYALEDHRHDHLFQQVLPVRVY